MANETLLLGAGASVEADVPDAKRMAQEIIQNFNADARLRNEADVLNFVNAHLVDDARRRAGDPSIDGVDVEALYNGILLLSERDELEISPFVESWLPDLVAIKNPRKAFANIMFEMERMLKGLTLIEDEHRLDYLKPILNLARHQKRLFVATLNYDNGIELLSRVNAIPCDTGIKSWDEKGAFDFPNNGIQLLKLHGSVYWRWSSSDTRTYEERLPHRRIRFIEHFEEKLSSMVLVETPMVIFGHRNKLTAEGPFLDLLKQFDEQLRRTDILTVVGYSFRDPHIDFYISKFLNLYGGTIRIVDPNFEKSDVKYAKELREFRKARSAQIEVIEKYTGDALKGLYPI